ncbi:MAG: hypothetical protein ACFE8A_14960 [Candidatus Hodarchaeota archaeon]
MSISNIVELEEVVYNAIQDYLNNNKAFNMNKIVPYLHNIFKNISININKIGIQKIIANLVKKKKIVVGSKLTKKDILLIPKRKKIYDYIRKNPGTYFFRILNELGLSNNVVVWHLSLLEKFDFIRKLKIDNIDVYFESNLDLKEIKKFYILSKEKYKNIIQYLRINDTGITKTQLSTELKIHHNTATKYLNSLLELEVISCRRKSRKILYFLNENYLF